MSHRIFDFDDEGVKPQAVEGITVASVRVEPSSAPLVQRPALFACPDCTHRCSQHAEACPSCGRFFRGYSRTIEVVPGGGWISKVAWGIVLSSFIWAFILVGVFMLMIVAFMALAGLGSAISPDFPKR